MFKQEDLWDFPRRLMFLVVLTYVLLARRTFVERSPESWTDSSLWLSGVVVHLRMVTIVLVSFTISRNNVTSSGHISLNDYANDGRKVFTSSVSSIAPAPASSSSVVSVNVVSFIVLSLMIQIETLIFMSMTTNSHQINLSKTLIKSVRENENQSNEILSQTQSESRRLHSTPFLSLWWRVFRFVVKNPSDHSVVRHFTWDAVHLGYLCLIVFFWTDGYAERDENIDRSLSWTEKIEHHRDELEEATKAFMRTADFKKGWRSSVQED